jgi:hypothetical protein
MAQRVLPDANVWYSKTLRDWLLLIEVSGGPYTTCWTEDILAEALYHLRRRHPDWDGARIADVRDKVVRAAEGGRISDFVVTGEFPGSDRLDRHVDAAARAGGVGVVVTCDGGFSAPGVADLLPYEVLSPDELFVLADESTPDVVREVAFRQQSFYVDRLGTADLREALRAAGCPEFGDRVERHLRGAVR